MSGHGADPRTPHAGRDRAPGRHLVLVGPTAVGKSAVAMALATDRIRRGEPVEIVSADSMQVYRGMDLGTAKPSPAERALVPHHLLDLVDPDKEYSVARYADDARAVLDDIESRGASALVVGGTGLYVQALVDHLEVPGRYPEVLEQLDAEADTLALHRRLTELDPDAAARMEPTNRRRVLRALEVTLGSGRRFSEHGPGLGRYPDTPFVLCGLCMPRDALRERIAARYRDQLDAGFLEEVRALAARPGGLSRTAGQALGYRELLAHVRGDATLDEAVDEAVARTRRFAIRQIRWFRRDPRIHWVEHLGDAGDTARRVGEEWAKRVAERRGSTATVAGDVPHPGGAP